LGFFGCVYIPCFFVVISTSPGYTQDSHLGRQLCEPIRASVDQVTRNPRAKVALVHVLQKEARSLESCKKLGLIGLTPRPLSEQFKKPTVLPLSSGTSA